MHDGAQQSTALHDFKQHFASWDAALLAEMEAQERGDTAAAEQHRAEADAACEAMLAAQAHVDDRDLYALAIIAKTHNPDLDPDDDGIDLASLGRLIDACLALGRQ